MGLNKVVLRVLHKVAYFISMGYLLSLKTAFWSKTLFRNLLYKILPVFGYKNSCHSVQNQMEPKLSLSKLSLGQ